MQHLEGVAGTVADGEYNVFRDNACAVGQGDTLNLSVFNIDSLDLAAEADFTTQSGNCRPHVFDHLDQPEGADVWLANVNNLIRCTGLDELFQYLAAVVLGVLDLAVKFAV